MVESTDRGVVDIGMEVLMYRVNIGWWLGSLSIAKRGEKKL